jgi:CRP/FNR family transcriptional regulator, anaerobic regulatory protein
MKPLVAPAFPRVPSLKAIPFLSPCDDSASIRLTERQREQLTRIGVRLRLPPRLTIYREDSTAHSIFAIAEGVVKSYRDLASGKRVVAGFWFPRDLFGLAENGRYVNTTQAVTRVTVYRLPLDELIRLLKIDGELQFRFLVKVTHELRESQRRTILLNRRDAAGRLAMFVSFMAEEVEGPHTGIRLVPLPMTRSDIAGFLGLSLESVSRAAAELQRRGLVKFENRHLARILDPAAFARLAAAV